MMGNLMKYIDPNFRRFVLAVVIELLWAMAPLEITTDKNRNEECKGTNVIISKYWKVLMS